MGRATLIYSLLVAAGFGWAGNTKVERSLLDPNIANDPRLAEPVKRGASPAAVLRAQVLLDRVNFSSGEIDGRYGSNLRKAIAAFQTANGRPASGELGAEDWAQLNGANHPALISYTISEADVAGPFAKVPRDMMAKARLDSLGYESAIEAIGETFHSSPKLLRELNPDATFENPGEQVLVPNVVTPFPPTAAKVIVDKSDRSVTAVDANGRVLAFYPATIGSKHDPLPIGTWKITGVHWDPVFNYNPELFWDADPSHAKASIAPGPNNPVGLVWAGLSKRHYGIHGTPEPSLIGKTQSHGCIRLTNWDAVELGMMVSEGTAAILQE